MITFKHFIVKKRRLIYTNHRKVQIELHIQANDSRLNLDLFWSLTPAKNNTILKDKYFVQGFELQTPLDFKGLTAAERRELEHELTYSVNLLDRWYRNTKRDVLMRLLGYKGYHEWTARQIADELNQT